MMLVNYFREAAAIAETLDVLAVDRMIERLAVLRHDGGRLFIIGGRASLHAVDTFREIYRGQAIALPHAVWSPTFELSLQIFQATPKDVLLVLSANDETLDLRLNIREAVNFCNQQHIDVLGIIGPEANDIAEHGDIVLKVPCAYSRFITSTKLSIAPVRLEACWITAFTEAFQILVLHSIVNDMRLRA